MAIRFSFKDEDIQKPPNYFVVFSFSFQPRGLLYSEEVDSWPGLLLILNHKNESVSNHNCTMV